MARFYQIKIGSIWLTKDGTEHAVGTGRSRLDVQGVDKLQSDYVKTRVNDMRGNPIIQKTNVGIAGREIVITVTKIPVSVAESLIALHRSSEENDTAFQIVGTEGDTPDFDLFVLPDVNAFEFKEFDGIGNYVNSVLRYVTVGEAYLSWSLDRLTWDGDDLKWT